MFDQKQDIKLMSLVRANPVLYSSSDRKYMDFNAREVAWHKIGDEMKRPAADCKQRWIHIRDVHRRILRNRLKHPHLKTRDYKYEEQMKFMTHCYKELSAGIVENEFDDQNDDDNNVTDDYHDDHDYGDGNEQAYEETEENEEIVKIPTKRRRRLHARTPKDQKVKKIHQVEEVDVDVLSMNQTHLDPRDSVDAFLLSIGATLKTFSPYHLNLAKSQIFSIVQQHEMQQIDPSVDKKVSTSNENYSI